MKEWATFSKMNTYFFKWYPRSKCSSKCPFNTRADIGEMADINASRSIRALTNVYQYPIIPAGADIFVQLSMPLYTYPCDIARISVYKARISVQNSGTDSLFWSFKIKHLDIGGYGSKSDFVTENDVVTVKYVLDVYRYLFLIWYILRYNKCMGVSINPTAPYKMYYVGFRPFKSPLI